MAELEAPISAAGCVLYEAHRRAFDYLDKLASEGATPLASTKRVFVELVTVDGTRYRRGLRAPHGTLRTTYEVNVPVVVEGCEEVGDWVEVKLSGGYIVDIPETRVARIVRGTVPA